MWTCKYCQQTFPYERTTEKANHSRWCVKNPRRAEFITSAQRVVEQTHDRLHGVKAAFDVVCAVCGKKFSVTERLGQFDALVPRYCSRSCACSVGGTARALRDFPDEDVTYRALAFRYYERRCYVRGCGFDKVVEVHHRDRNRENNEVENLIPLCPNHHAMVHRSAYREEIESSWA
jgi:predicted restriction endonuclease